MQKQIDLEFYQEAVDTIAVSEKFQSDLKGALKEAFENPRSFYDESGTFLLSERGLSFFEHLHLTPKFVLIDKMIEKNQMVEVDWKEDEHEIRLWLIELLEAKKYNISFSAEPAYENEDTFTVLNLINDRELKLHGYCLEILDINSDSYLFTVVSLDKQNLVADIFAKLSDYF